jgi:histone deacetylase 6
MYDRPHQRIRSSFDRCLHLYHLLCGEQALGYNINVGLNVKGLGDREYLCAWDHLLIPVTKQFAPDLVLVSAGHLRPPTPCASSQLWCTQICCSLYFLVVLGFDCACRDPLGGMEVTTEAFAHLTHKLMQVVMLCCISQS